MDRNSSLAIGARVAVEFVVTVACYVAMAGLLIYPALQAAGYVG